jgi:hypothetical protein
MVDIGGDVAAASGAFAGLILVFFGASLSSFDAYSEEQRGNVRNIYRLRAWPAFAALVAAILSCGLSLYGKAAGSVCAVGWSCGLLAFAGVAILVLGIVSLKEIG